jgi:hypothetical protein
MPLPAETVIMTRIGAANGAAHLKQFGFAQTTAVEAVVWS